MIILLAILAISIYCLRYQLMMVGAHLIVDAAGNMPSRARTYREATGYVQVAKVPARATRQERVA